MHSLLVLLGACLALFHAANGQGKRVCYYSTSSQYRPVGGKFMPEDIDPALCSHLVYHKAVINNECHLVMFEWNDEDMYARFNLHKESDPDLRTLLAVARTQSTCDLSIKNNRLEFAEQSLEFLREWNFDGLVVDFEVSGLDYPNYANDFSALLQEVRGAYDAEVADEILLLVAAVSAIKDEVDTYYNKKDIGDACDWVSLETYDFRGPNRNDFGVTYNHAGLHARSDETDGAEYLNVEAAINYWIGDVESEKLVMGIGALGIGFKLDNVSTCDVVGCPITGPSTAGEFTREPGIHSIYEACIMYPPGGRDEHWDEEQLVPFSVSTAITTSGEWITHENTISLEHKAQWSLDNDLGGWSLWSLDMDDYSGVHCGQGPYAMLSVLNRVTNPDYVPYVEAKPLPADN